MTEFKMSSYRYLGLIALMLLLQSWHVSEACMCMPSHPQSHYCQSDFVIIATPKFNHTTGDTIAYKLKIRKEFKMSEKAKLALKSGWVTTALEGSMCGVSMDLNRTYLITGRILSLEAKVNLCNFIKPWKEVNPRQRKGFKMLYKQGCECRIQRCNSPLTCSQKGSNNTCKWLRNHPGQNCQNNYGICFQNKGVCHWAMARKLTQCLHSYSLNHYMKPIRP